MQDFNPYSKNEIIEEKKLHGARKVTARRLKESYQNKIHASMYNILRLKS